jgi:hypothetical protein
MLELAECPAELVHPEGDELVTTPASFYATAKAISLVVATPVFADVSPEDNNLDPAAAGTAVTSRTEAVLVVHLSGRPGDIEGFRGVPRRAGILLRASSTVTISSWSDRPTATRLPPSSPLPASRPRSTTGARCTADRPGPPSRSSSRSVGRRRSGRCRSTRRSPTPSRTPSSRRWRRASADHFVGG